VLHPYIIDFAAMARGYSLGVAAVFWMLYFLMELLSNLHLPQAKKN